MAIRDMVSAVSAFHGIDFRGSSDVEAVQWLIDRNNELASKLSAAQYALDNIRMQMDNEPSPISSAFRSVLGTVRELAAEQDHDVSEILSR